MQFFRLLTQNCTLRLQTSPSLPKTAAHAETCARARVHAETYVHTCNLRAHPPGPLCPTPAPATRRSPKDPSTLSTSPVSGTSKSSGHQTKGVPVSASQQPLHVRAHTLDEHNRRTIAPPPFFWRTSTISFALTLKTLSPRFSLSLCRLPTGM